MPYFNVHAIRDDVPSRVYLPDDVEFIGTGQSGTTPGDTSQDEIIGGERRETPASAEPPKEVLLLHRVHAETPEEAVAEAFRILSSHIKQKSAHPEWVQRFQAGRQADGFRVYLAGLEGEQLPGTSWLVQQGTDGLVSWDEYDLMEAMRSNADALAEVINDINERSELSSTDEGVAMPDPDVEGLPGTPNEEPEDKTPGDSEETPDTDEKDNS